MANMTTGSSLAKGGKRNNRAKAQVDSKHNAGFNTGKSWAENRQHPTDTHPAGVGKVFK